MIDKAFQFETNQLDQYLQRKTGNGVAFIKLTRLPSVEH